ncbi:MAG TPA: PilZ domain-containing protein [Tepidisphaeraceae bacterium]|jgi:hypothetical protein|nr:PilZ domain-containing protein [Tepidisphaeraceae bacterium]
MVAPEKPRGPARTLIKSKEPTRPRIKEDFSQKRAAERKAAHKEISLRRYAHGAPGDPEKAIIIDISVSGIGLVLTTPMKYGDQFLIELTPTDPGIIYRVMRCRPCGDNAHRVGAAFLHRVGSVGEEINRIHQAILH